jgi:hypothetical protein
MASSTTTVKTGTRPICIATERTLWQNRRVKRSATALAIVIGVFVWPRASASQTKLPPIVQRASEYVTAFVARFSSMVADEVYIQETTAPRKRRELHSDFLLVKPPGQDEWFQFRDVYKIDGKPVTGREQRMVELFVNPPANLIQRVREVMAEGTTHNLEDIGTLDRPLIALSFLQAQFVDHFAFIIGRYDNNIGPDVRIVQFREVARPTLLRGGLGDLPSRGIYWIEEETGRVVKTELDFRSDFVETTFRYDVDLRADVPVQMKQRWRVGRDRSSEFNATATYGRFRRFNVQTDEKIGR